jgi:2'-hydroxyisoflavone reductase
MSGETAAASLTSTARAQKAGLKTRPMQATVNDTLAWFQSLPADRQAKPRAGIDPQREADTLREWHVSGDNKAE